MPKTTEVVNFNEEFSHIDQEWTPKRIVRFDDYYVSAIKMSVGIDWHIHNSDQLFMVVSGKIKILFRDFEVELSPGESYVIPFGVEHRPVIFDSAEVLLIEKIGISTEMIPK